MVREEVYRKNLRIILKAIQDRNIPTAERMIREEIQMSEGFSIVEAEIK